MLILCRPIGRAVKRSIEEEDDDTKNPGLFAACVWLAAGLWPSQSRADTDDSFLVRNALDIVTLCSLAKEDPLYTAAANFCQGYVVGAYHYSRALTAGPDPDRKPLVCLPNPQPTIPSTTMSRR